MKTHPNIEDRTMWHQRGWTLQENIFSLHNIIFKEDGIEWICPCHQQGEDIITAVALPSKDIASKLPVEAISLPWPEFRLLAH
jgi:hypothetical protein